MSYFGDSGFGSQSALGTNSTITPLSGGATFTGTAEQNPFPDVMCSCYSDTAGTLYFDFSVNGTDWRTFPTTGYSVSAGIHEFHIARKGPRYFRVRFINAGGAQTTFQLYTYFGAFGQAMAPIGFNIADDADAIVTKSVISGVGDTTARVTDHKALQVTSPDEGKTAFGEALTARLRPVINHIFPYSINPYEIKSRANNAGTISVDTSMLSVSTGASANSSAEAITIGRVSYEAGLGVRGRFTGVFTTGVANSTQIIGLGDNAEGFFFGYNGTAFGVLHRYGGAFEIRTLTVTTASTTAENITVTLDGDADATVAVTNSGNTTTTANEIAAHDYSDVGDGWDATAVGATVIFTSWTAGSKSGTYSISGTTAAGTFASTVVGADPTENWTAQASWNGEDIFDGAGLTGVTLDPTKGNVFQITFQYLGFGAIKYYIEDPDDGELHLVHTIEYANANTRPSLNNPTLPMIVSARNTSNSSDVVLKSGSLGAFIDGEKVIKGVNRGVSHTATISSSGETPIFSWRTKEVFNSKQNRSTTKINLVSCAADHTKVVRIKFYANATLTNASFSDIDSGRSAIQKDTSATAISGGLFLFSVELGRQGSQIIDLKNDLDIGEFDAGNTITCTCEYSAGTNAEVSVSYNITEII